MRINRIILNNFRQFYNEVDIHLNTTDDQNIVLIGGKNGCGKTNFLLSVVWCLYGERIKDVDETFKTEIANNYSKFLNNILNKDKKTEGGNKFSVELSFVDVLCGDNDTKSTIRVRRNYDIGNQQEQLEVIADDESLLVLSTDEEKQNFINDYLIPIEIAKFVFFDAEKISQIADLSATAQAKLMDQTLGNMLGLNIYQNVADEIDTYAKKLKKESATHEIQEQITNFENTIKSNNGNIDKKKEALIDTDKEVNNIEDEIKKLEIEIDRKGGGDTADIESLHAKKIELQKERDDIRQKFHNMADIIPLFMLSGLMQEANEHIRIEENNHEKQNIQSNFSEKIDAFMEELFNKGKSPTPDIGLKQKMFYVEKSNNLANCFVDDINNEKLPFEHCLDKSKIVSLNNSYKDIQTQSNTDFIATITNFSKKREELSRLEKEIRKLEVNGADELTKGFIDNKKKLEEQKINLFKEIGSIDSDISKLEQEVSTAKARLSKLYEKAKISADNKGKIDLSEQYIKILNSFITTEKEDKKEAIKNKLLKELKILWDKELVLDANLRILPNDKGMEVELLDKNNSPIQSESLSKGEQQLYVSALLKAILANSIHNLPVFIDTPLARLDSTHRDNILQHYYPNLSTQVVIFSTDTEITPIKYENIKKHIAKSHLIVNQDGKSDITNGYFN